MAFNPCGLQSNDPSPTQPVGAPKPLAVATPMPKPGGQPSVGTRQPTTFGNQNQYPSGMAGIGDFEANQANNPSYVPQVDNSGNPITWSFDDAYRNGLPSNSGPSGGSQYNPSPSGGPGQQAVYTPPQAPVAPPITPPPVTSAPGYQPNTQGLGSQFGNVQTTLNTGNLPPLQSGADLMKMLTDSRNAAYQNATGYLDPQFKNQEQALRSQLINQGIPQNSEAWNRAMDDFGRQKQFAYQQAESNAVNQGNAAQSQLFGQGLAANQNQFGQNLSGAQFGNSAQNQYAQQILQMLGYNTQQNIAGMGAQTANNALLEQINQNNFNNSMGMRNQDINELLLQQQNPLQILNMLMSGQNVQSPNFAQTPNTNMGGTDINSILNGYLNSQNNSYNAQIGNQNSQIAGLGAIGAGLASTPAIGAAIAAF